MGRSRVIGVGINDADYDTCVNGSVCPYYRKWADLLRRCYSKRFLEKRSSYKGCTVCKEWHTFSNFKRWMEKQDWEGKVLDKDLLSGDDKIYSPDTCVFLPSKINNFLSEPSLEKSSRLRGVGISPYGRIYYSSCNNPITNKREHLGMFDSEVEAHQAWLKRKYEISMELIAMYEIKDNRVELAFKKLFKHEGEN